MPLYEVTVPVRVTVEAEDPVRAAAAATNMLDEFMTVLVPDEDAVRVFDETGVRDFSFGNGDAAVEEVG